MGLEYNGGLGGQDGSLVDANGEPIEDLVPGFSASALKFVRKVKKTNANLSDIEEQEDNDEEQLLAGDEDLNQ